MPLTAIADFAEKGKTDPLFKELARLVEKTHGIWNEQAEKYLLAQFGVDIGEAAQRCPWRGHYFALRNRQRWLPGRKPAVATKIKLMAFAVTAMRQALNDVAFRGRVVIGEGERYPSLALRA